MRKSVRNVLSLIMVFCMVIQLSPLSFAASDLVKLLSADGVASLSINGDVLSGPSNINAYFDRDETETVMSFTLKNVSSIKQSALIRSINVSVANNTDWVLMTDEEYEESNDKYSLVLKLLDSEGNVLSTSGNNTLKWTQDSDEDNAVKVDKGQSVTFKLNLKRGESTEDVAYGIALHIEVNYEVYKYITFDANGGTLVNETDDVKDNKQTYLVSEIQTNGMPECNPQGDDDFLGWFLTGGVFGTYVDNTYVELEDLDYLDDGTVLYAHYGNLPIIAANNSWHTTIADGMSISKEEFESQITAIELVECYDEKKGYEYGPFDISQEGNSSVRAYITSANKLFISGNGSGRGVIANVDTSNAFSNFTSAVSMTGMNVFDTVNANTFESTFSGSNAVKELDLSTWKTGKSTSFVTTFYNCNALTKLNISNWDSRKIDSNAKWGGFVASCSSLTNLIMHNAILQNIGGTSTFGLVSSAPITVIDANNLTLIGDASQLFYMANSLKEIKGSESWNVSEVTNMYSMFNGCNSLEELYLAGWDTRKCTNFYTIFYSSSLKMVDISDWYIDTKNTRAEMFFNGPTNLKTIYMNGLTLINNGNYPIFMIRSLDKVYADNVTIEGNNSYLFNGAESLKEIVGVASWDVSKCTSMNSMFYSCSAMEKLNLSTWDTKSLTDMDYMFFGCTSLVELILNNWDVKHINSSISISKAFAGLPTLEHLEISGWDLSGERANVVINTSYDREGYASGSSNLKYINLNDCIIEKNKVIITTFSKTVQKIDAYNLKVLNGITLFTDLIDLEEINGIETWDMSECISVSSMFESCRSLRNENGVFDLTNWKTDSITDIFNLFFGCYGIKELNLSGWNTTNMNATEKVVQSWGTVEYTCLEYPFLFMYNLEKLDISGWDISGNRTLINHSPFVHMDNLKELNISNCKIEKKLSDIFPKSLEKIIAYDTEWVGSWEYLFSMLKNLETIEGVETWRFVNCDNISYAFWYNESLTNLDLSNWNVENIKKLDNIFGNMSNLRKLNLCTWNPQNVENLNYLFLFCESLEELDISSWDFSSKNLTYIFGNLDDYSNFKSIKVCNNACKEALISYYPDLESVIEVVNEEEIEKVDLVKEELLEIKDEIEEPEEEGNVEDVEDLEDIVESPEESDNMENNDFEGTNDNEIKEDNNDSDTFENSDGLENSEDASDVESGDGVIDDTVIDDTVINSAEGKEIEDNEDLKEEFLGISDMFLSIKMAPNEDNPYIRKLEVPIYIQVPAPPPTVTDTPNTSKPSGGGGGSSDNDTEFTVTFEENNGTNPRKERTRNHKVQRPNDPSRPGYVFDGWYTDEELIELFDFSKIIHKDITLYAKWIKVADGWLLTDEHIAYIEGFPDGLIHPDEYMTRGQVAAMIYRLLRTDIQSKYTTSFHPFVDVSYNSWYETYIAALYKLSIVEGIGGGYYAPDSNITRAQFATILVRFLESTEYNKSVSFVDVSINHWAYDYICKAVSNELIEGYGDGRFGPDDYITRAQAITMMNRLLDRDTVREDSFLSNMKTWVDNTIDKWYYNDVQEATNKHSYEFRSNKEYWVNVKR